MVIIALEIVTFVNNIIGQLPRVSTEDRVVSVFEPSVLCVSSNFLIFPSFILLFLYSTVQKSAVQYSYLFIKTSGSRHYRPTPSSAYGIHLYPYPYPYPHPYPYPYLYTYIHIHTSDTDTDMDTDVYPDTDTDTDTDTDVYP